MHVIFLALLPNHAILHYQGVALDLREAGKSFFTVAMEKQAVSYKINRAYLIATLIHEFQTIARTSTYSKYWMALVVGASAPTSYAYEVQQKPILHTLGMRN